MPRVQTPKMQPTNDYFDCPFNYEHNMQCSEECDCFGCKYQDNAGFYEPCASCRSIGGTKCNRVSVNLERMPQPHGRC